VRPRNHSKHGAALVGPTCPARFRTTGKREFFFSGTGTESETRERPYTDTQTVENLRETDRSPVVVTGRARYRA